jgi:hypothetical protein
MKLPALRRLAEGILPVALLIFQVGCENQAPAAPTSTVKAVAVNGIPATFDVGATANLTASATYSDGSARDCTGAATWSSSDTRVAVVSSAGLLAAVEPGDADIRATCAGITGSGRARVTVGRRVVSVAITGIRAEWFVPGDSAHLTATATYSDNSRADCTTSATWMSSNPAVAGVSAAGVLTGVAAGQTSLGAACGGAAGEAAVTVVAQPPPPVARLFTSYDGSQVEAVWMVTPVWFDATRSTGVELKYLIEFGDGQSSAESLVAHVPAVGPNAPNGGRLTVTDRWGRIASATAQYLIFGFGFGSGYDYWRGPDVGLKLAQDRSNPTSLFGRYDSWTQGGTYIGKDVAGTVGPDRSVHLVSTDGTVEFTGYYHFSSRQIYDHLLVLRVRGGVKDGQTVVFHFYDGP